MLANTNTACHASSSMYKSYVINMIVLNASNLKLKQLSRWITSKYLLSKIIKKHDYVIFMALHWVNHCKYIIKIDHTLMISLLYNHLSNIRTVSTCLIIWQYISSLQFWFGGFQSVFYHIQVLPYENLHMIEKMMCKSYISFAHTTNTHSKISYNA